jgi:hypothetical protein
VVVLLPLEELPDEPPPLELLLLELIAPPSPRS